MSGRSLKGGAGVLACWWWRRLAAISGFAHREGAGTFSRGAVLPHKHASRARELHPIAPYRTLSHPIALKKSCEQGRMEKAKG
jgi:hypothetical protein